MEFSNTYKQSGPCCFSPDSRFLAIAVDYRLAIRDVVSLKVVQLYSCLDKISYIEWAPTSEYLLCGLYKRALVQVWSVSQPEWTCKIDEGSIGIVHARWSPDSRHILTISEFQLRLTVWSLVSTACVHVPWPKHPSKAVSFTKDGKYIAIGTRRDCRDYLHLLACQGWEAMGSFEVGTSDLADLEWSPNDSTIAVWDSPLEYKVLVYSPDGRCLFKYSAYEHALGVRSAMWSPCGQFLSVGSYDQVVRVLNRLTWKPVAEFTHRAQIRSPHRLSFSRSLERLLRRVFYKVVEAPVVIPSSKPPVDKPNPKQGIGLLAWSADSQYFFTKNDNMPNALWIWDVVRLELLALLIQKDSIRSAAWDPISPRIALCTGASQLYLWTPSGACCVQIPLSAFYASEIKWIPDGSSLLLKDKEAFCCSFVPMLPHFEPDDENEDEKETAKQNGSL